MSTNLFPVNSENRPIFADAFHLAVAELAAAGRQTDQAIRDGVLDAILSLGVAGETDPAALARHAVAKFQSSGLR